MRMSVGLSGSPNEKMVLLTDLCCAEILESGRGATKTTSFLGVVASKPSHFEFLCRGWAMRSALGSVLESDQTTDSETSQANGRSHMQMLFSTIYIHDSVVECR